MARQPRRRPSATVTGLPHLVNWSYILQRLSLYSYIFERFEAGDSRGKISDALADMGIASPSGKAAWSRETISKLLANEKYMGDVILGKTQVVDGVQVKSSDAGSQVRMKNHHSAIIPRELFDAVQKEKRKRSRGERLSDE